jgi:hypothetical protein
VVGPEKWNYGQFSTRFSICYVKAVNGGPYRVISLVPKPELGNPLLEAPASTRRSENVLPWIKHRYKDCMSASGLLQGQNSDIFCFYTDEICD